MKIEPGTIIPLVYQNVVYTTDQTLYYVRAVIKDSLTGTTLDTKNLTHQGTGRYTSSFLAPQDTSGQGRHIDITITVYTDSGYTTKSTDYQERNYNYVVQASRILGGGGGGSDVNYEYIKKIIDKLLDEKLGAVLKSQNESKREEKPLDLSFIKDANKTLLRAIKDVRMAIKPQEKTDLSSIEVKINSLEKTLIKKIEKKEDINFDPIFEQMSILQKEIINNKENKHIIQQIDISPILEKLNYLVNYLEMRHKNIDAKKIQKELKNSRFFKELSNTYKI